MKPRIGFISFISACALAVAIGATTVGLLEAQQKQEYKPRAESKKLVETALHGSEGKKVTIMHFKFPPGFVGGKHYHTGPVFVYVAKGALTVEEEGKAQQTFRAGQVYAEPIGQKMVGRNLSSKEPLDIVVFQVHGEGEPLMFKAD
jgi:quercetin dioxygenase-like cupin family protein